MNLTKEQKRYIKRRVKELKVKRQKTGWGYWKVGLLACLLLLGCSAFRFADPDITSVLITEAKFLEAKLAIQNYNLQYALLKSEEKKAEVLQAKRNFGCTPEKKPEPPAMVEPKPEPKPEPAIVKPIPKKVGKAKAKAVIYKVKREGNTWTVKMCKSAVKSNTKVRIFIGYCYYESIPDKDGNATFKWYPPNQTKVGVSVFQLTNNPEIGSGNTLCSVVIPMP